MSFNFTAPTATLTTRTAPTQGPAFAPEHEGLVGKIMNTVAFYASAPGEAPRVHVTPLSQELIAGLSQAGIPFYPLSEVLRSQAVDNHQNGGATVLKFGKGVTSGEKIPPMVTFSICSWLCEQLEAKKAELGFEARWSSNGRGQVTTVDGAKVDAYIPYPGLALYLLPKGDTRYIPTARTESTSSTSATASANDNPFAGAPAGGGWSSATL